MTTFNISPGEGFLSGSNSAKYFNGVDAYGDFGTTVYWFYNIEFYFI